MPVLSPSQALLIGLVVAPVLFALCAWFTRASPRRMVAALMGGVVYSTINYFWDQAAFHFGWWRYPVWLGTGKAPLWLYALAGIAGGGCGLIGWRVVQRWGRKGFVGYLLFWAVYALVHDIGGSKAFASSQFMIFEPGIVPIIADMLWFITGDAAALGIILLVKE